MWNGNTNVVPNILEVQTTTTSNGNGNVNIVNPPPQQQQQPNEYYILDDDSDGQEEIQIDLDIEGGDGEFIFGTNTNGVPGLLPLQQPARKKKRIISQGRPWSQEEEEMLVQGVKAQPELYDHSHPDWRKHGKNSMIRTRAWQNIADQIGVSVLDCRKHFKALRDKFVRSRRLGTRHAMEVPEGLSLDFLIGNVKPRPIGSQHYMNGQGQMTYNDDSFMFASNDSSSDISIMSMSQSPQIISISGAGGDITVKEIIEIPESPQRNHHEHHGGGGSSFPNLPFLTIEENGDASPPRRGTASSYRVVDYESPNQSTLTMTPYDDEDESQEVETLEVDDPGAGLQSIYNNGGASPCNSEGTVKTNGKPGTNHYFVQYVLSILEDLPPDQAHFAREKIHEVLAQAQNGAFARTKKCVDCSRIFNP